MLKILFMCVANSARSQLAEGLAARILGPKVEVQSAGSHPGRPNPFAVQVMREIGIDISKHYSKSIDQLPPRFLVDLDYVITLCAEEVCPTLPSGAKKLAWPHPDPASKDSLPDEEALRRFREARDALASKLGQFKAEHGL